MSDLTVELRPEDLSADQIEQRLRDEIAELRKHRDPEQTCLKLAALLQAAIQRLRMGESHDGTDRDRSAARGGRDAAESVADSAPVRTPGGRWVAPGSPQGKASLRPH